MRNENLHSRQYRIQILLFKWKQIFIGSDHWIFVNHDYLIQIETQQTIMENIAKFMCALKMLCSQVNIGHFRKIRRKQNDILLSLNDTQLQRNGNKVTIAWSLLWFQQTSILCCFKWHFLGTFAECVHACVRVCIRLPCSSIWTTKSILKKNDIN